MVWVGRHLKAHLVPTPCHEQGHLPPDQVAQSSIQPGLEHCQGGGSHSFSGQPGPVFHPLMVKNFFLISNLNLPSFSLKPLPLVLSLHTPVQSPSPSFLWAPSGTGSCSKVIPQPSLLQAEQPQLPQPVLIGEVLQPSDHLRGLLWTRSNTSMSFLSWGPQSWTQYSRWGLTRYLI